MIYKLLATVPVFLLGAGLVFLFVSRLRQLLRLRRDGHAVTATKLITLIAATAICPVAVFFVLSGVWTR